MLLLYTIIAWAEERLQQRNNISDAALCTVMTEEQIETRVLFRNLLIPK